MNHLAKAALWGVGVTAVALLPMVAVSAADRWIRRKEMSSQGITRLADLSAEEMRALEGAVRGRMSSTPWLRPLELAAFSAVYPALIANAVFRVDRLRLPFIVASCLVGYSAIAWFLT